MSNHNANDGIRMLLSMLADEELISLTKTVTQSLLKDNVSSREGKF